MTNLPVPRNTTTEITPLDATPDPAAPDSDAEQSDAAVKLPPAEQLAEHLSGTDDPVTPSPDSQDQGVVPDSSIEQLRTGTDSGRYIVQVASFGAVENAKRLSGTLSQSGYSVANDSVESDVGTLHRVRVGPFDSEAEANQAVAALESSIAGVKPRVMDLQPERAAQVSTPNDPLVRWVVQVGSFSSSANAENLVAALRLEGHSAYRETISNSGSEIYRVRIGPFLLRDEAIRAEHQVREKMSLKGVVMSAD